MAFAFARGAAAAKFELALLSWWPSVGGTSMVGKGKALVTSRFAALSMPTRNPVAVVG